MGRAKRRCRDRGPSGGACGPSTPSHERRIVILQSAPEPRPTTNPYITQLLSALRREPSLLVLTFSWHRALRARYDVFHVHWPDILVSAASWPRRWARRLATAALLARLTLDRTPVVRTMHNTQPHESVGVIGRGLLRWLDRLVQREIHLQQASVLTSAKPYVVVPHGHYREWYSQPADVDQVPGRLCYVGFIRPYKNVEALLLAFRSLPDPGLSLHVVGAPRPESLAERLLELAAGDPRVQLRMEHVDDDDFAAAVSAAELVVLPYSAMLNSGTALAALSLNRSVLLPANRSTAALADEVGPRWVQLFIGDLDGQQLKRAVEEARRASGRPDLSSRGWEDAGARHLAVYRSVIGYHAAPGASRHRS